MKRAAILPLCLLLCFFASCTPGVSLTAHPSQKNLTLGFTEVTLTQLSVEVKPAGAKTSLEWSSSNTEVAAVDERGTVTALAAGTARITVTDTINGGRAVCTLKVYTLPQAVVLRREHISLRAGRRITLAAKLLPSGYVQKLHRSLTWSSSNPAVATVDARGRVTAVASGSAEITATTVNGVTATCVVEVP